jgi:hypothetical protein
MSLQNCKQAENGQIKHETPSHDAALYFEIRVPCRLSRSLPAAGDSIRDQNRRGEEER